MDYAKKILFLPKIRLREQSLLHAQNPMSRIITTSLQAWENKAMY